MGMTMAEKILARASKRDQVSPHEFVTAELDLVMGHDLSFWAAYQAMTSHGFDQVFDPEKIVVIIDHLVPAMNVRAARAHQQVREWVKKQGIKKFFDCGVGVCHQIIPEQGLSLPGRLIVGGDSHTTTYGALGAASCGIGVSELAWSMAKGSLWFMVPETIRFDLTGELPPGVSAKDIILKIAGDYTAEVAQYKAVEFAGPAAKALSLDGRMTISNMGVEIGAKFALFEADEKIVAFLNGSAQGKAGFFGPDPDAVYENIFRLEVSELEPQIACPHNVDNVKPVSEIGEVIVNQAFLGSCTNARMEDLVRAAAILKGRHVHPETRLIVMPASRKIYQEVAESGLLQVFLEAGAMLGTTGCGPCGGSHLGILAPGETAISSTNRNFKGRMGSPESFIYLGSPETVAASAIEGKIADPRKYL